MNSKCMELLNKINNNYKADALTLTRIIETFSDIVSRLNPELRFRPLLQYLTLSLHTTKVLIK